MKNQASGLERMMDEVLKAMYDRNVRGGDRATRGDTSDSHTDIDSIRDAIVEELLGMQGPKRLSENGNTPVQREVIAKFIEDGERVDTEIEVMANYYDLIHLTSKLLTILCNDKGTKRVISDIAENMRRTSR